MTESSHKIFIDYRTEEQRLGDLATPILIWYDEEGKKKKRRRRVNGVAVTTDGLLMVADAVCSRKDQFIKAKGRLVVEKRILGRAKGHCVALLLDTDVDYADSAAAAYREFFPENEAGAKRAYNAGKMFAAYREEITRKANELDEF